MPCHCMRECVEPYGKNTREKNTGTEKCLEATFLAKDANLNLSFIFSVALE